MVLSFSQGTRIKETSSALLKHPEVIKHKASEQLLGRIFFLLFTNVADKAPWNNKGISCSPEQTKLRKVETWSFKERQQGVKAAL